LVESDLETVKAGIAALLSAETAPAQIHRANKVKSYDLRPLIIGIQAKPADSGGVALTMRLRAAPEMTARADQVLLALGLSTAASIWRTRLQLDDVSPVLAAYRARGWMEDGGG
jgi:hypothetical protein